MGFADIAGLDFLDGIFDRDNLTDTAKTMAGGTLGGMANAWVQKQSFLQGSDNMAMLKQVGAGFAVALLGGMAMDRVDSSAAKGFVGGVGGQVGGMLVAKFVPSLAGFDGAYLGDAQSSFVQFNGLESTRVLTDDDLPANLGRVSVGQPDPAELASLMSAF